MSLPILSIYIDSPVIRLPIHHRRSIGSAGRTRVPSSPDRSRETLFLDMQQPISMRILQSLLSSMYSIIEYFRNERCEMTLRDLSISFFRRLSFLRDLLSILTSHSARCQDTCGILPNSLFHCKNICILRINPYTPLKVAGANIIPLAQCFLSKIVSCEDSSYISRNSPKVRGAVSL
jgi:hypothetical protein